MRFRFGRELSVFLAYAALLVILAVAVPMLAPADPAAEEISSGSFFSAKNLRDLLVSNASVLVAAVGMTLVILARQIDLSVGAQASICGVAGSLAARAGVPMPLVLILTVGLGAGLGALNGWLVAGLGLPSIVVTLATWVTLREGLRWYRQGQSVRGLPAGFQWFGLGQEAGQWTLVAIAFVVLLIFAWSLRYLAAGRAVYATGSDPEAARLAGLQPRWVVFFVFVIMGALVAASALLNAVRFTEVAPNMGDGFELKVIAPVVLGGVSVAGGRGTLLGTLLGVALLGTIGSALVFLRIDAHWEKVVQGAIILIAVASDSWHHQRRPTLGLARVAA